MPRERRATSNPANTSSSREERRSMSQGRPTSSRWSELTKRGAAALILLTLALQGAPGPASRWWTHVEALANDGMEGRNTGSPAHKRAADYVASKFKKPGLEPAGLGGYIQPVAFKTRRIVEAQSSLALVRNGKTQPLTL